MTGFSLVDFLYSLDLSVFYFVNIQMQNRVFDAVMPLLTDLNKQPLALGGALILWVLLLVKGGREGRIAALLLIPTIAFSDQFNSTWLKHIFERPRPCHVLPDVHLLVTCGSGFSFPSSHAVNNFAAATVLSFYLRKWLWWFLAFASFVAFSRVYVGVHYPSDVLGGSILGIGCGALLVFLYRVIARQWSNHQEVSRA